MTMSKTANTTKQRSTEVSTRTASTHSPRGHTPLIASTPANVPQTAAALTPMPRCLAEKSSLPEIAVATGAAKQTAAAQGPYTSEREFSLQSEESETDDSTGQEAVFPTPPGKATSHNISQVRTSGSFRLTSDDAPLGSSQLIGVKNILIPVSTVELFFKRFDMLEMQIDELKSLGGGNPSERTVSTVSAPVELDGENVLSERVLALERQILIQNKNLSDIKNNCDLLLGDNSELKDRINLILRNTENLLSAHSKLAISKNCRANLNLNVNRFKEDQASDPDNADNSVPAVGIGNLRSFPPRLSTDGGSESCEVIINGIVKDRCDASQEILEDIAFATLSTVLLSLERKNIVGSRILQQRSSPDDQNGMPKECLGPRAKALPSCVMRLDNARRVGDLMRAKRGLANNYLTISDLKLGTLGTEYAAYVPKGKICINEKLPQHKFQIFKSLKPIAQGLSFKYIWHSSGRFLVRRKGGERAHVFASAADLQAIRAACLAVPKKDQQSGFTTDNSPLNISSETAQKSKSAAASF